jgi:RNA methyltransferase, TrmH family
MEKLTSTANFRIKRLIHLSKANTRKELNLFVIEGYREIKMAISMNFKIEELYICPELNDAWAFNDLTGKVSCPVFDISKKLFEKVAYRDNTDGIIALAEPKYLALNKMHLSKNPLILVLESVEKPGNLGALLRTADAASLDGVIVCDPKTDIFNPNVIRSSLGCVFTQQVVTCTSEDTIRFCNEKGIKTYAAALTAKNYYHETDLKSPSAIVMGTESTGLTDVWLKNSDEQIKIPMQGKVDSLNVSTSAAILVFEAMRQRGFKVNL